MRIESSVTSISWIPSAAIAGVTRIPFELGVTHYDDPPPDEWKDLDAVIGPEGARFANDLHAWIDVEDGRIVRYGQGGGGRVSDTLVRLGGMRVIVQAKHWRKGFKAQDKPWQGRRKPLPIHVGNWNRCRSGN